MLWSACLSTHVSSRDWRQAFKSIDMQIIQRFCRIGSQVAWAITFCSGAVSFYAQSQVLALAQRVQSGPGLQPLVVKGATFYVTPQLNALYSWSQQIFYVGFFVGFALLILDRSKGRP